MSDSRSKNSIKNMSMGFVYQTIQLILGFVSRTVFIRTLGTEYLGLNGIFSDVLQLLSMADLGFSSAMAYSFYKPLAEGDNEKIASLIAFYKSIYNKIAIGVTVIGLACIPFLKYIVNTEEDIPHLEIYYLFSLAGVVISYLFVYKTTLLTADQKDYKVVKIRTITSVTKVLLQIAVLYLFRNYILYLAIGVILNFLNNLIASLRAQKEYPYIKGKHKSIDKEVQKSIFENIKSVFIYKISGTLFNATDNILISMIVGTAAVGLYSNYLMVSSKLLLVEQIIFSALTASVGNVIAKEAATKRYKIFQAIQSASFILCGIIVSVYCIMINDIISVWLGHEFLFPIITVWAITLNTYFNCVLQPLWIFRDATGMYLRTKFIMFIGAIINLVLSILLGNIIGVTGIIFASALARISSYFWFEPKILFKEYFEKRALIYYISILKNFLIVFAVVFLLSFVSSGIAVNSWGMLIAKGIVIGCICTVVFLLTYMKTEGFQLILNKVKSFIHK